MLKIQTSHSSRLFYASMSCLAASRADFDHRSLEGNRRSMQTSGLVTLSHNGVTGICHPTGAWLRLGAR